MSAYRIVISNDNADPAGSLLFGSLLGGELERRSLRYTPHYTLALMGHRRRILVDADAGVYRYDQLIVLRQTTMPAVLPTFVVADSAGQKLGYVYVRMNRVCYIRQLSLSSGQLCVA